MSWMKLFDSNGVIVPAPTPSYRTAFQEAKSRTVETVEKEMKSAGITRALVRNPRAMSILHQVGNNELLEHISGKAGFYPSFYLVPTSTQEMGPVSELLIEMREKGVKAVWLAPGPGFFGPKFDGFGMAFTLDEWCVGKLFSELDDHCFPVFIEGFGHYENWNALDEICKNHPDLPIVITVTNKIGRVAYPMLKRHENIYISTAEINDHLGLEEFVHLIGAERIVFGSEVGAPAGQVNQLLYADLDKSDVKKIASANLERLLGSGVDQEMTSPGKDVEISEIERLARSGTPLKDIEIIDCHVHIGEWSRIYIPDNSEKALLAVMDRVGIKRICANHIYGILGDMRKGNDEIAKLVSKHPDRFIGVGIIDPNFSRDEVEAEIKRCVEDLGFRMIKIHPAYHVHNVPILDPKYEPVWEGAKKYGYIILTHTTWGFKSGNYPFYNPEPDEIDALAEKCPEIIIIMGHSGNNYPGFLESIKVAKRRPNVYLDTSGLGFSGVDRVERAVKEVGADRILFGTDWTYLNQAWGLGFILYAKISDENKRKILGGNMSRLLREAEERYQAYKKRRATEV